MSQVVLHHKEILVALVRSRVEHVSISVHVVILSRVDQYLLSLLASELREVEVRHVTLFKYAEELLSCLVEGLQLNQLEVHFLFVLVNCF